MRVPKQEIIDALDNSIAHWERMRDGKGDEGEQPGPYDCSLCDLFNPNIYYWNDCVGCPIAMHTGDDYCDGSPYRSASDAFTIMKDPKKPTKRFKDKAQKMIDFLKEIKAEQ